MGWNKPNGTNAPIKGGQNKVVVLMGTTTTMSNDNVIARLSDISEFGSSAETETLEEYHLLEAINMVTTKKPKDVTLTEHMSMAQVPTIKNYYKNDTKLYVGIYSTTAGQTAGTLVLGDPIYTFSGTISDWGGTIPDGDYATLTYTFAIQEQDIALTTSSVTVPTTWEEYDVA